MPIVSYGPRAKMTHPVRVRKSPILIGLMFINKCDELIQIFFTNYVN